MRPLSVDWWLPFAVRQEVDQNRGWPRWHPRAAPAAGTDGVNLAKAGKLGQGNVEHIQDAPQFGG